eukprot:TRINITY_DN3530_c0_g1_i2.p1 TRINITY_DN3530_c0_g1~~TRINITY_DN3530_c0_g1_i2.p1  ORF type:complete len:273 (-),score=24.62 TRINITY_DN3530_c0_g1_i2:89-907(-)
MESNECGQPCQFHSIPIQYLCQDCSQYLCPKCYLAHSCTHTVLNLSSLKFMKQRPDQENPHQFLKSSLKGDACLFDIDYCKDIIVVHNIESKESFRVGMPDGSFEKAIAETLSKVDTKLLFIEQEVVESYGYNIFDHSDVEPEFPTLKMLKLSGHSFVLNEVYKLPTNDTSWRLCNAMDDWIYIFSDHTSEKYSTVSKKRLKAPQLPSYCTCPEVLACYQNRYLMQICELDDEYEDETCQPHLFVLDILDEESGWIDKGGLPTRVFLMFPGE